MRHPLLPKGSISARHATPTHHPTSAGRIVKGNWDRANCAARRYVIDLSERRRVSEFLAVAEAGAAGAEVEVVVDADEVEEGAAVEEVDVEMRYLNVCGMTAWN